MNWLNKNANMVIALCALILTTYELYVTREHNRLSVIPNLDLLVVRSKNDSLINVELKNRGHGSAVIREYELSFNNLTYKFPLLKDQIELKNSIGLSKGPRYSFNGLGQDQYISPNESINLLTFTNLDSVNFDIVNPLINSLVIKLKYESIYEVKYEKLYSYN